MKCNLEKNESISRGALLNLRCTEREIWSTIPENPFLHVDTLSHEQHLGLSSISWPMEEVYLIGWIDGHQHFPWAWIHKLEAAAFLFHPHPHSNQLIWQGSDARLPQEHLLLWSILCAPANQMVWSKIRTAQNICINARLSSAQQSIYLTTVGKSWNRSLFLQWSTVEGIAK